MVSLICFVFLFFSDTPIYGFADDYVFMIRGLLDLYEASLDDQWLQWAVELQAKLDETLWDSEGAGYFMGTPGDPSILVRMKEGLFYYRILVFSQYVQSGQFLEKSL